MYKYIYYHTIATMLQQKNESTAYLIELVITF